MSDTCMHGLTGRCGGCAVEMADMIAESVAAEPWAIVDWELRTRHPAEWTPPESDAERRALLTRILNDEHNRGESQ